MVKISGRCQPLSDQVFHTCSPTYLGFFSTTSLPSNARRRTGDLQALDGCSAELWYPCPLSVDCFQKLTPWSWSG